MYQKDSRTGGGLPMAGMNKSAKARLVQQGHYRYLLNKSFSIQVKMNSNGGSNPSQKEGG